MVPRLSVVMPVRDAGPYLDASIRSILAQSYDDFAFVIRDDGSVDGSTEVLQCWAERDRRIELHVGERSLGPAESSNWVVRQARSPLVARMDADDIAHPDRLRLQAAALDADAGACLVGTLWEGIDAAGRRVRPRDRWRLSRTAAFAPFPHGSIMFRREAFDAVGGYRKECSFWEDADLYLRLAEIGRLIVLPDVLYLHRASALSTRITSPAEEVEQAVDRMYRRLAGGEGVADSNGKVSPMVFVSLGSTALWAGGRPRYVRRIWRRAALGFDAQSAAVLAWAAWSTLSPHTLRSALRTLIRLRDRAVRHHYLDGQAYDWRPVAASAATAAVVEIPIQTPVEAGPAA